MPCSPRSRTRPGASVTPTRWTSPHRARRIVSGTFDKRLHVSPFMSMDHVYRARATTPGLDAVGPDREATGTGRQAFEATLNLRRAELTRAEVARMTAGHPVAGARALALIYGHAAGPEAVRRPVSPPPRSRCRRREAGRAAGLAVAGFQPAWRDPRRLADRSSKAGGRHTFGSGAPAATIELHDPRFWRMLMRGSRGLAESYIEGDWDSPDLVAVIRLAARNASLIDDVRRFTAPLWTPRQRLRAVARPQHPQRQPPRHRRPLRPRRRAVRADARSDDDVLVRAVRARSGMTLEEASVAKLERVCEQLAARPRRSSGRDRHRLGIARGPRGRDTRLPGHHDDDLRATSTPTPRSGSRRPGCRIGCRSCCRTTVTCAAATTSWSRSR